MASEPIHIPKSLASRIRPSEYINKLVPAKYLKSNKEKNCYVTLVCDSITNFEKAVFIFSHPRISLISARHKLLRVFPVTKELQIVLRPDGFLLQWSYYTQTSFYIRAGDSKLFSELSNNLKLISLYQREPFRQGSATHQWVWYYEEGIKPELKQVHQEINAEFSRRATVALLPEHSSQGLLQNYMKQQLKKREAEYTDYKQLDFVLVTWNAAGTPPLESIKPLLICSNNHRTGRKEIPDIIVVSLQEMCPLTAKTILSDDEIRKNEWLSFISNQVGLSYRKNNFSVIMCQSLVGLLCVVMVNKAILKSVAKPKETFVKLGLRGYTGNKGALCLRFQLLNTSVCIVNLHLAAHTGNFRIRNKQLKTVMNDAVFNVDGNMMKINEHDHVFVMGDLNYRIKSLKRREIISKIYNKELAELTNMDELVQEKLARHVLTDFKEGPLSFFPTFKVIKGSCDYNEKRDPAWCDRILWKGSSVQISYDSCPILMQSDHKPVFSEFKVPIQSLDTSRFLAVQQEISKFISGCMNKSIPNIRVSSTYLRFPLVYYKIKYTQELLLENHSDFLVMFSLSTVPELADLTWLDVTSPSLSIPPNSATQITVNVYFTEKDSLIGNIDSNYMNSMFILSIMNGSDIPIAVEAQFIGSCFGATIHDLIKLQDPAACAGKRLKDRAYESSNTLQIPKELGFLCDFIETHTDQPFIFQASATEDSMSQVRIAVDNFDLTADLELFAACNVLVELLEAMPYPLIDIQFFDSVITKGVQELFEGMDEVAAEILRRLAAMARRVVATGEVNCGGIELMCEVLLEPLTHFGKLGEKEYSAEVTIGERLRFLQEIIMFTKSNIEGV